MGQFPTSTRITSQVYRWRINSSCVSGTPNDCSWHKADIGNHAADVRSEAKQTTC